MKRVYDNEGAFNRLEADELSQAVTDAVTTVFRRFEGVYAPHEVELMFVHAAGLASAGRRLRATGLKFRERTEAARQAKAESMQETKRSEDANP